MSLDVAAAAIFILGSLLYFTDGVIYVAECLEAPTKSCTTHSALYASGSFLFALGSTVWLHSALKAQRHFQVSSTCEAATTPSTKIPRIETLTNDGSSL